MGDDGDIAKVHLGQNYERGPGWPAFSSCRI
jgi:hypothetical protein